MKDIDIIDSYKRLPIGMYLDIIDLCNEEMTDLDRQVEIISMLSCLTTDEVLLLPLPEYKRLSSKIVFLEKQCEDKLKVAKCYNLDGWELVLTDNVNKMTAAQYIDFQTYYPDGEKRMVELLSVVLVPKGMQYCEGYDIVDVQKAIRENLSVTDVLSTAAFFLTSWATSINRSRLSSIRIIRTEARKDKARRKQWNKLMETLGRANGDGSPA